MINVFLFCIRSNFITCVPDHAQSLDPPIELLSWFGGYRLFSPKASHPGLVLEEGGIGCKDTKR